MILSRRVASFFDEKYDYFIELADADPLCGAYCEGLQGSGEADCDRGRAVIRHEPWPEPVPPRAEADGPDSAGTA